MYILDTAALKGVCRKLSMPWKGPGVVTEVFTPYLFRVKLRTSYATLNHDRMKLCTDAQLPAWVVRTQNNLERDALASAGKEPLYCDCRRPYKNEFMIFCETCLEWYFGQCVGINAVQAKDIDKYVCHHCRS